MPKLRPTILLLAFALLIQNTCPHGAAGKSTVAAACSQCPMHSHHILRSDLGLSSADNKLVSDSSEVHFPMFVFAVPKPIHTFQLSLVQSLRPVLSGQYQDALPHELLRPPRA